MKRKAKQPAYRGLTIVDIVDSFKNVGELASGLRELIEAGASVEVAEAGIISVALLSARTEITKLLLALEK